MKKTISIILSIALCMTMAACKTKKNNPQPSTATPAPAKVEPQKNADFSRTAGVWRESGASETLMLVMDGAGAVSSLYPDGTVEFEGYLGYDAADDTYSIYDLNDQFISEFTFDSDTQLHIGDDTEFIYVKTDEKIKVPELISENEPATIESLTANPDYNGGYFYSDLTDDGMTTIINTCFNSTIADDEFMEAYIVRSIANVCEEEIRDVVIEETREYTDKILNHVYLVSWVTGANENTTQWKCFFFNTTTHTYMYTLRAPIDFAANAAATYTNIFDGLYLSEE